MHTASLRLPDDTWEELSAIAVQEDRSTSNQIVRALKEWLAQRRAAIAAPTPTPDAQALEELQRKGK